MVNLTDGLAKLMRSFCCVAWMTAAGCTQQHEIITAAGKGSGENPVVDPAAMSRIKRIDGEVRIEAASKLWNGAPVDFESYFTPFALDIDNLSSQPMTIRADEFFLEDDEGRIASALIPMRTRRSWVLNTQQPLLDREENTANWQRDNLEDMMLRVFGSGGKPSAVYLPDRLRSGPSPVLGGSSPGTTLGHSWSLNDEWSLRKKGIILGGKFRTRAVRVHDIDPDERMVGFVYFPRVKAGTKHLWLSWQRKDKPPIKLAFRIDRQT